MIVQMFLWHDPEELPGQMRYTLYGKAVQDPINKHRV